MAINIKEEGKGIRRVYGIRAASEYHASNYNALLVSIGEAHTVPLYEARISICLPFGLFSVHLVSFKVGTFREPLV